MSKAIDIALKAAEQQHEKELNSKLQARMNAATRDMGKIDSFRHTILSHVASENYQRAIEELNGYVEVKKEYPQFRQRAERYIKYAVDLTNGIKAKRSFPGMNQLSMSKQQELYDRAMSHFDELKMTLKKIEQIEVEIRLDDVRSTVWVVKALIYSFFAVLVLAFLMEISQGVLPSVSILVDDGFGQLTNWLFDELGL